MSAPQNDSGVFSFPFDDGHITLRDAFAIAALQAVPMPQSVHHDVQAIYDRVAQHAYKMADAMLRARKGGAS